jgi:hypothetical protein
MRTKNYKNIYLSILSCLIVFSSSSVVYAFTPYSDPAPQAGSYGLEATKTQPAPTTGATISVPGSGSASSSPITVGGICPSNLLVEIFDNGVMEGAEDCNNGSFSIKIDLFNGQNSINAMVYDNLNQAGPASNTVTINFASPSYAAYGQELTLTSSYGRIGVDPGNALNWPIQISGGSGPYALSINWGDGSPAQLMSQLGGGTINIGHTYNNSGIYNISVEATDHNGLVAFLQLVAVANGNVPATSTTTNVKDQSAANTPTSSTSLALPAIFCLFMLLPSFFLGRASHASASKVHHKHAHKRKDKEKK